MPLRLGVIADDFTGATDVANALVRAGMQVVQTVGVPAPAPDDVVMGLPTEAVDAVVVALKTRTVAADVAVTEALRAAAWLRRAGAEQLYFKYCSTFDSTAAGNIGPVTEALLEALGSDFTIATPAFPQNGRTVFKGHLFVGDVLLSDSGMRHHPLTPMTDANLVRVLQAQCGGRVGLVDHAVVAGGPRAIRERFAQLRAAGVRIAVVDAVTDADLVRLGAALAGMPLVTAASGVATALPANWGISPMPGAAGLPSATEGAPAIGAARASGDSSATGAAAVVAGSVSEATNRQVADFADRGGPIFVVDPLQLADGVDVVADALAFAAAHLGPQPVLISSTKTPDVVAAVQHRLGAQRAAALVESALAAIAVGLVTRADLGVRRLVVAGGETAGAVVDALGIRWLRIGQQIDPGVPWCRAGLTGGADLHLALKSGNFGTDDFFTKAFAVLT